ncbi:hypothetical protein C8J45_11353 [Sphingomonas sp. PP-CE-3G-477]|nr:hypothetical protein C8J45_11353 [Sphingomonas sp. PP-CE-3G-477]
MGCSAPVPAQAEAEAPPLRPLIARIHVFGARIGMTRAEVLAHMPATAVRGVRCTTSPSEDPKLLFLECGRHNLTVDFTAAGKVWQLRGSYDFTDTPLRIGDARTALIDRYGKPAATHPVAA